MHTTIAFDQDNTILTSHSVWDELFRQVGLELIGREISMTTRPDGQTDRSFTGMSCYDLFCRRLGQMYIDPCIDEDEFNDCLSKRGRTVDCIKGVHAFPQIQNVLRQSRSMSDAPIAIVSGGPRTIQTRILETAGLTSFFDLDRSYFLGEFESKRGALDDLVQNDDADHIVYFGDDVTDMEAVMRTQAHTRTAIGVSISGQVNPERLVSAGAAAVVSDYDTESLLKIRGAIDCGRIIAHSTVAMD